MMHIQRSQVQVFEAAASATFEEQMVAHARAFSPQLHKVIGTTQMRFAVRRGILQANKYGFTLRGPMRFYIDLSLLLGSDVGDDPQYPWAGVELRSGDVSDQLERASNIHAALSEYLERVHGPDNHNIYRALQRLVSEQERVRRFSEDLEHDLVYLLKTIHPEKYSYTEPEALQSLIRGSLHKTRRYTGGCVRRDATLMTALAFCFGHGCDSDALYPWIQRTLDQIPRIGPTKAMNALERKSVLWLKAVLKNENYHDEGS